MNDIVRVETDERLSRAVVYGGIAYLSGVTAKKRDSGIKAQTKEVLATIEERLRAVGTDKSRILHAQIWLKDIAGTFADMNEVWNSWTVPGCAPTRATAQCQMASPEILIEIIVTAALPLEKAGL